MTIHPKDKASENPRLQCAVCAKWKRLRGTDHDGNTFYRFFGGCSYSNGGDHLACNYEGDNIDVCDECCHRECMKIAGSRPAGPSSIFLSAD